MTLWPPTLFLSTSDLVMSTMRLVAPRYQRSYSTSTPGWTNSMESLPPLRPRRGWDMKTREIRMVICDRRRGRGRAPPAFALPELVKSQASDTLEFLSTFKSYVTSKCRTRLKSRRCND